MAQSEKEGKRANKRNSN